MTHLTINEYYRILSMATLIFCLTILIIPNEEYSFIDKIWSAIGINIAFHLMFHFLSRMPFAYIKFFEDQNPKISKIAYVQMNLFSNLTMVLAVTGAIGLITLIIVEQYYERLTFITVFAAVFLGGRQSKLKLKEYKNDLQY